MSTEKKTTATTVQDTKEFFTTLGEQILDQYEGNESDAARVLPFVGALLHSDGRTD